MADPTSASDAQRRPKARRTPGGVVLGIFKWIGIIALALAVLGGAVFAFVYATTRVPNPNEDFQTNVSTVYFNDGEQVMSTFFVQNRVSIPLAEMPENIKQSIVAAENETFWEDPGISVPGLLRAVQTALTPGEDTIGGSTITQQYIKVLYLTQDKTLTRKLTEIVLSLKAGQDMSKEEILEGYLNTVYFGRGAYGIQTAAQAFFAVDAKDLNDQQAIALSAIINAPNHLDPAKGDKQRADLLERYQYTINQMVKVGYMTEERKAEIYTELPDFPKLTSENRLGGPNGYLVTKAKDELVAAGFTESQIEGSGLKIITTVDKEMQDAAILASANMAERIARASRTNKDPLWYHPALASIDTRTGAIVAMYNGPDAVTDAIPWAERPRPSGSTFKPWALVAGLRNGATLNTRFNGNNGLRVNGHSVSNAGGGSYGSITVQDMTTRSVNTAYVDMVRQMTDGPAQVEKAAIDTGAVTDLPDNALVPTIPLGFSEVSPLNAARGLATLVNGGKRSNPYIVSEVQDMQGQVIYRASPVEDQTVEPAVAQNAAYALTKVVEDGTARSVRNLGHQIAGKTGTYYDSGSRETKATWFIGSTQQISTAVALTGGEQGFSDLGSNVYGSTYTAPAWLQYMRVAMKGKERLTFPGPTRLSETGRFTSPPTPTQTPTATATPTPTETATPTPTDPGTDEPGDGNGDDETPEPEPTSRRQGGDSGRDDAPDRSDRPGRGDWTPPARGDWTPPARGRG